LSKEKAVETTAGPEASGVAEKASLEQMQKLQRTVDASKEAALTCPKLAT
jgi:hypothetical protein